MKLLVQEFLETHSFKELEEKHGVYASFSKSGHKFSLNYDQIEAVESDPLAQECRGLILSRTDGIPLTPQILSDKASYTHLSPGETTILAYPMKRFFNYSQGAAADIDFNDTSLSIFEKLDGSLIIIYYDPFTKVWCAATRAVPEADLLMDNQIYTFRTLFEKALLDTTNLSFDEFTQQLDINYTYCFELTTPYNQIVVIYPTNGITLLTARGLITHQELEFSHPLIEKLDVPKVISYKYNSIIELVDWVSSLDPMQHEGVVVRDSNFNRIKIKSPAYVAFSKIRDSLAASPRNMVEIVLAEKDDDVMSFLPEEIAKNLLIIKNNIKMTIRRYDDAYQFAFEAANLIKPNDKKTFAILVSKNKELWGAPLFSRFDGKSLNMKDFIQRNKKEGTWSNGFLDRILEISQI